VDPITGEINCDLPVFAGAGTGTFVVNIAGTICMMKKANELGINDPLGDDYNDPVSVALRGHANTFGQEHVWAINLPGAQTGPWEYWDSTFWKTIPFPLNPTISLHEAGLATNPDMSLDKANAHIDTAIWFFAPRAYAALKLGEVVCSCNGVAPDPLVINDFECRKNFGFGAGGDKLTIVNNPQPDGDNDSEKVGRYQDPANDPWAALCVNFDAPINLAVFNQFEVQINSPAVVPILFKLEGGSSPAYEVWVNTTAPGTWEQFSVDFSSQAAAEHTRVCMFPNGGVEQPTEDTYWFDNLRWDMQSSVLYPEVDPLEIAPNPVADVLYIRNPGSAVYFKVMNSLGQQVKQLRADGQEIVTVLMGDLQQGVYLIGAYDANGKLVANGRILKN
jgi:hypothetical protein